MAIHIGTSGWSYKHWKGRFYPEGLPAKQWLSYYCTRFQTTELNNSFYRWPTDLMFASWARQVPPGFLFTVKASRILTHYKKLLDPEAWITRISQGVSLLGDHFGLLLVQLPPNFPADPGRLEYFLARMPTWVRTTVEFRHPSWHGEEVFAILERHHAAYCIMSGARLESILRVTAPFIYLRMHGPDEEHLYGGSYSDEQLAWWAEHVRRWDREGREVFVYFNNDPEANAVRNALRLMEFVGG